MIEEETDEEEGWAKRTGQEKENCFRGDSHNGTGIVGRCYFFDSAEEMCIRDRYIFSPCMPPKGCNLIPFIFPTAMKG